MQVTDTGLMIVGTAAIIMFGQGHWVTGLFLALFFALNRRD